VKVRPAITALVLPVLAALAAPADAQQITLRYKWMPGDVLIYRTTVRTNSTVTGGPAGPVTYEQTLGQTLKVTVAAVAPDGTATVQQVIDAVTLDTNGPSGRMSYDSAKPPAGNADPRVLSVARTLGAMVGEPISVAIAPNGAIRRIDGAARLVQKLMADLPRDPMAGGLAQNLKAMLSEDALRSSLEQSFSRLPDAPVKPGDTWTAEQSVGADVTGKVVSTSTFTLKAIEGAGDAAVARVAVALALTQPGAPSGSASMAMRLTDGKGEGELLFNIPGGRIQRNGMQSDISSTATMRGAEGTNTTVRNAARTTMTMELVKWTSGAR
jgi:hypothetical protein